MTCDNDYDRINGSKNPIHFVKAVMVIVNGHSRKTRQYEIKSE